MTNKTNTQKLIMGALLTALVIVFQLMATYTAFFGPFSTAIGLIPIAIGAILCGPAIGAWLGFVFGIVVLASGGAALFLAFDIVGTFITVLAKGTLCGLICGYVYKLLSKYNVIIAAIAAAIICPITNTGVFLLGCAVFFLEDAVNIGQLIGNPNSGMMLFVSLALANFIFEMGMNAILSPIIVRLVKIRKKSI